MVNTYAGCVKLANVAFEGNPCTTGANRGSNRVHHIGGQRSLLLWNTIEPYFGMARSTPIAVRILKNAAKRTIILAFPNCVFLTIRYILRYKRIPNLIRPSRFTDKILCKMAFDRNQLLPIIADKLAVRDFVKERIGKEFLTKIFAVYNNEDEIQLETLPERFVLKANHGWNFNYFVQSPADKNYDRILPLCHKWLTTNFGQENAQWAYESIDPKIYAEEYLDADCNDLIDYNIYCFDGEPKFLRVLIGRTLSVESGLFKSRFFDLEWNTIEVTQTIPSFPCYLVSRPQNFADMIEIAKSLSHKLDFLRVDLYYIQGRIVFSELTNYPGSGLLKYDPPEYDYIFGSYWSRQSMVYLPIRWRDK